MNVPPTSSNNTKAPRRGSAVATTTPTFVSSSPADDANDDDARYISRHRRLLSESIEDAEAAKRKIEPVFVSQLATLASADPDSR
jgi:hypothetical protein